MYENLHFRRQFLLTRSPIEAFPDWKSLQIGEYYLYAHPDLDATRVDDPRKSMILVGSVFDPVKPEKGNAAIMQDILESTNGLKDVLLRIKQYAGCYVLLFRDDNDTVILSDARALREIYYCTEKNRVVCGSQPHLIAKFLSPEARPTNDRELLKFYRTQLWDSRWIGNETCYEGIRHLMPNHYFDVERCEAPRYWPNEPMKRYPLNEAVTKSCSFLQGIMSAVTYRHPVMMAVTSGTDSRTLMAASRAVHDKIYYFVNNQGLGHEHPDISVPEKMFENIGLPFHVHDVPKEVDDEFRRIFLSNVFLATEGLLPAIYNVFYRNHGEKVLILGVGEIGRTFYGKTPKKLHSYRMAYKLGYKDCRYVIRQCEQFLAEMLPVAERFGMNVWDLLYWEQRLGNWGAVRNSESAIAVEKLDPFDSRLLLEVFLGVDEKFRDYRHTPCVLFREMIRTMWPDLLKWPINPPYKLQEKLKWVLGEVGIFNLLKELKYQLSFVRHVYKARQASSLE